jgi:hypothetical protein
LTSASPALAAYVTPRIGGAQRMHMVAPMIMPEITIVGSDVVVLDEAGNDWTTLTGADRPVMWPLEGTDAFDPASVWYSALNGTAYNWQYGWNNAGFNPALLPAGGKIWLEMLSQSDGLKTYDRNAGYAPIFGTDGASTIWKWSETMAHNAYTVTPGIGEWSATYLVYIGDEITGEAIAGFGSATVTLTWTSVPEPATLGLMMAGLIYLRRKN